MSNSRYWSTKRLDDTGANYRLAVGERSNGKTTAALLRMLDKRVTGRGNGVYMRQMEMDIQGQRGSSIFRSLEFGGPNKDQNLIELATNGEYHTTKYTSRAWYLGKRIVDENGNIETIYDDDPFCYAMALSQVKHDKSATPANVTTIVFDEFVPLDGMYLNDESSMFFNAISTIVRDSARAEVYLIANTTTWNGRYFKAFGINKKLRSMNPGEINVYTYPKMRKDGSEIEMKVAVEYCIDSASTHGGKDSDVYFVSADSNSAMITDGKFAIPEYPKCPVAFTSDDVKAVYWVDDGDEIIRCRLMKVGRDVFVFADLVDRERFERISDETRDLFYSYEFSSKRNHFISPIGPTGNSRAGMFRDSILTNRIFFESNEVGEDLMYFVTQSRERNVLTL